MNLHRIFVVGLTLLLAEQAMAAEFDSNAAGYRLLTEKAFIPPGWDDEVFNNTWRVWPPELRKKAAAATPAKRREMAFRRYGLTLRPGKKTNKPLQFVVDSNGKWSANCFTCHGGKVAGKVIPGLPNSHYAIQTLTEEILRTKALLRKPLTKDEVGQLLIPLGSTNGTTNAVIFGIALGSQRDPDLNLRPIPATTRFIHHDMDAPPWWHFKIRPRLYIDGFAKKSHRALMQFALDAKNGPKQFQNWEKDFRIIYDWMSSLDPPKYPLAIDADLASRGKTAFTEHCSQCHGTYDKTISYPSRLVAIDDVKTDPVRLSAITTDYRMDYQRSWFAEKGKHKVIADPGGYVAPPLTGIWASAPYFHNGSVPTLYHVLNPARRPAVWKRSADGYDHKRVGLEITTLEKMPDDVGDPWQRRSIFDTSGFGKNRGGHSYPDELSEAEKRAVLEYLKTL